MKSARQLIDESMSETAFQAQVLELAERTDWRWYHTHDSRRSNKGWPDLVLIRPPRLLFVELKKQTGKVTSEQQWWLDELVRCGREVYVWRPADWDEVMRVLARDQEGARVA